MGIRWIQFPAILLTALDLVPGGAHLLEFRGKITLYRDAYFTTQQIYRGWAYLGAILIAAILANMSLAFAARQQRGSMLWALASTLLLSATLVLFFLFTFPANQATDNWTTVPADWWNLRLQWEYSHAINAGLTFLALCATLASCLSWVEQPVDAQAKP
jgi:hypothetical protein